MGTGRPAHVEATLARARECFERREWRDALAGFAAAGPASLGIDDLERLAVAAYLTGHDEQSDETWLRAHESCLATCARRTRRSSTRGRSASGCPTRTSPSSASSAGARC